MRACDVPRQNHRPHKDLLTGLTHWPEMIALILPSKSPRLRSGYFRATIFHQIAKLSLWRSHHFRLLHLQKLLPFREVLPNAAQQERVKALV